MPISSPLSSESRQSTAPKMHDFRNHPRWEKKWHSRAYELEAAGHLRQEICAIITAESGRTCYEKAVRRWLGAKWPLWQLRWRNRAAELHKNGHKRLRIAAIIEMESGRPCYHSVVSDWLVADGLISRSSE